MISVLKVDKTSNSANIRQKAIPKMHPSVVQTMIVFCSAFGFFLSVTIIIQTSADDVIISQL